MWLDRLLMLAEIAILLWMLRLDRENNSLYREFFETRTKWYASRTGKRKTPVLNVDVDSYSGPLKPSPENVYISLGANSVRMPTLLNGEVETLDESTLSTELEQESANELSMNIMEIDALAAGRPDLSSSLLTTLTESMKDLDTSQVELESENIQEKPSGNG